MPGMSPKMKAKKGRFAVIPARFLNILLYGWGRSNVGQVGDGTTVNKSSPVNISNTGSDWSSIDANEDHTLALKSDGTIWAWGEGSNGELGQGSPTLDLSTPAQIGTDNTWSKIAIGQRSTNTAIKTDGTLWTWGQHSLSGALGQGSPIVDQFNSPDEIFGGGTTWSSVAMGNDFGMATKSDGTIWTWGRNDKGQLGQGSPIDTSNVPSPVQVLGGGTDWDTDAGKISAGPSTAYAIKTDGTLWVWGSNASEELGYGSPTINRVSSPIQTVAGGNDWSSINAGDSSVGAIKTDGTLWMWGESTDGELGNNYDGSVEVHSPVQTVAGGTDWSSVDCGDGITVAIKTDGTLWTWGFNNFGNLGDGTTDDKSSPVQIGTDTTWTDVAAGRHHMMGIKGSIK